MTLTEFNETPEGQALIAAAFERWGGYCFVCRGVARDTQLLRSNSFTGLTADDLRPMCDRCRELLKRRLLGGKLVVVVADPERRARMIQQALRRLLPNIHNERDPLPDTKGPLHRYESVKPLWKRQRRSFKA
jgi:hypothetical protein